MANILVTGTAGFIGFHLSRHLLSKGHHVHGFDGMTDYYDVSLKRARHAELRSSNHFSAVEARLEEEDIVMNTVERFRPDAIVHLAAQAGVRYSLENPRSYIDSNIVGTFNVMEAAKEHKVGHLLCASTSSVYGSNEVMPFTEIEKADTPITIYAATKKANEVMCHSYSHLWDMPITMFRFFTVYGTWGRPDLALYKFVKAILADEPIDIYNHGDMYRDFTYVDDLVRAIALLIDCPPPSKDDQRSNIPQFDSLSPVAPFRIVNIGNSEKIKLLDFIDAIEGELGIAAKRNYMGMQTGDVPATWADTSLLQHLTNYKPETHYREGIKKFVEWYRDYYAV